MAQQRDKKQPGVKKDYNAEIAIKCGEFPLYLRNDQLLKRDSAAWT